MVLTQFLPRSGFYLILVCIGAAACQSFIPAASTPTVETTPTAESTPEATATETVHVPTWEEVEVNDIRLGIEVPAGWEAEQTEEGLLLAEHFSTMEYGTAIQGLQIHLFVHALDGYTLPVSSDTNVAWAVLEQIIRKKDYIGEAMVSAPMGFEWDGHDAAYYLLNNGDGNLSVLMAVAIPAPKRLVVCNFSSPVAQAYEIRDMLPEILSSLTINGVVMKIDALHNLPDPLRFPESRPHTTPSH